MLKFYPISNPNTLFDFIDEKEIGSQTWIVSDLKSKNEIQKLLVEKQGFFLESSILRASDFWKIILRRLAPQIQVVSSEFIQMVVDNYIEKYGADFEILASEASTLSAYVQELAPILLHPESEDVLREWFSSQTKIKKWQRWHLLAKGCMKYIVYEHHIIDSRWIAAFLQTTAIENFSWSSSLVVDLGTEMSSVEMGLFKTLSKKIDTKVIIPEPVWKDQYPLLLKTYDDNKGFGKVFSVPEKPALEDRGTVEFIRVSTQLAEVKYAVSQVRKWVDQGIPLQQISIISADIEKYWSVLKYFFDEEGLVCQKDHIIKVNSLGLIQNFMAYCLNLVSEVGWDTLETSIYSKQGHSEFRYDQFKSLFYQLYDESDLTRDEKIKDLFYQKVDLSKKLSRDEFLGFIVRFWSEAIQFHMMTHTEQHTHLFELVFKDFLARSSEIQADFKKWLGFLQSCINTKEIKIELASAEGLQILPVMSAHLTRSPYQVWLGLDEKSLASRKKTLIPTADIFELKTKFDFSIEYPEESFYDFNTRWLLDKKSERKIFLCANSSFEAEPLTPSLFFLENNAKHDISIPPSTRHDDVQIFLTQFKMDTDPSAFGYDTATLHLEGLKRDLFPSENRVSDIKFDSFSPTDIEDYWKCPFKVLVHKAFKLKDLPQVAVDLDARQKGSLLHHLFEFIITVKSEALASGTIKDGITKFLDMKRVDFGIYPQDDLLWNIQKNKLLQIGLMFFEFEKQRIGLKHEGTEKSFELLFDLDKKSFVKSPDSASRLIKVKGRIDRVDRDSHGVIIYDYKSTTSDLKNYTDWIDAGEFQLLLYLIACENVLYPDQKVVASVYYDYRKFDFSKGYMELPFHQTHIVNSRKKKALSDDDKKKELLFQFNELLTSILTKLENFDFSAQPVEQKICIDCHWSKLCRAPHLM